MKNLMQDVHKEKDSLSSESVFSQSTPPKLTNMYKMYKIFLLSSFGLHAIFSILFFMYKFQNLAIYNVLSTCIYVICASIFKLKRMNVIFLTINLEVLCFLVINTICIGWNYNFYLYFFLALQLTLFSSISRKKDVYNLKLALIQFVIISICTLFILFYATTSEPLYKISAGDITIFKAVSIINFIFISLMTFLLNFSLLADVNIANQRLASTNDELNHIATHDPLTNLINRRSMNEQFYIAIDNYNSYREMFSLILADIDDFKKVNDIYGHDSGDIVLKRVSKIISDIVREPGVVCRWGGEEILILVYGNLKTATKIAEQIREAVENTSFTFNNTYIKTTLTLGVAEYNPSFPIGKAVTIADENLYRGKKSTKNCVIA